MFLMFSANPTDRDQEMALHERLLDFHADPSADPAELDRIIDAYDKLRQRARGSATYREAHMTNHSTRHAPPANASVPRTLANGRRYEQLSGAERHILKRQDRATFDALRSNWQDRGEPIPPPDAA